MGLTASQTVSGGSFSPAGYEDPLAAGPTLHPIAPPMAHLSLSFDGFAYGLALGRSCRSQAGPPGWSTSFGQAWPLSIRSRVIGHGTPCPYKIHKCRPDLPGDGGMGTGPRGPSPGTIGS